MRDFIKNGHIGKWITVTFVLAETFGELNDNLYTLLRRAHARAV